METPIDFVCLLRDDSVIHGVGIVCVEMYIKTIVSSQGQKRASLRNTNERKPIGVRRERIRC